MVAPFTLLGLDHIVLRVYDIDRMLGFYQTVLGCTLERVQAKIGLYQLRAGRQLIDLIPLDGELGRTGGAGPGPEGRNLEHFCLEITPFDDRVIRAHLARHGVTMGSTAIRNGATGEGPSIYLTDPEGNTLELKGTP
ncbi:VOC family virulence protein [Niveispirillum lacus]|uniref:VOC family virulence protein n=1 Tax=Niveispirillum lacus TaxID=1981099 RepID=A0A255Z410_9PROT|nr:VOC family protein [Niveispirillum lacus]OYQ35625.1 VOC family virulence protein [Niveispirillum lacus]